MNTERARHDYEKALRARHLVWKERDDWHRDGFEPVGEAAGSLIYEEVLKRHEWLRELEERAYDRFLQARAIYEQACRRSGRRRREARREPASGASRRPGVLAHVIRGKGKESLPHGACTPLCPL